MHYKQSLLTAFIFLSAVAPLSAQRLALESNKGFYIEANAEYAIPVLTTKGFEGNTDYTLSRPPITPIITRTTVKKTSFGDGIWTSLHFGYFFTDNIGLDMGVQMGVHQITKEYTHKFEFNNQVTDRTSTKTNHPILISPSIAYRAPIKGNVSFQGKAGIVLPFNTTITQEEYSMPNTTVTSEITNRFALGFSCSLGAEYKISPHVAVSAEANMVALSVDTKRLEITSYNVDGKERIAEIPENFRMINYEYEHEPRFPNYAIYEPTSIPFSRLGIRVGVAYYF